MRPAHECYIQLSFLTFTNQTVAEPIGRVPYNRKLYEAMNSFMKFLFRGRRPTFQLRCLNVFPTHIIRLPEGVKFNIRELKTCGRVPAVLKIMSSVLNESCFPIKHINQHYLDDLDDPFVKDAEELTFTRLAKSANLFEILQNLPFLKVNFLSRYRKYDTEELITFIKNILENDDTVVAPNGQFKAMQISYRTYIEKMGPESVEAAYVLKIEVV
ncbi:hypothetical protein CAEBREN_28122 [Caenorhabditis brenneri]|uniref:DUF38 domain-containing protein n=1 Tax=Caenorhabditis brenneri TaxID=135651 RepID=G0NM05_CAEBE|nr:hypothetical protein CAEBREN_28122 [Caenorhabditis brenneri]